MTAWGSSAHVLALIEKRKGMLDSGIDLGWRAVGVRARRLRRGRGHYEAEVVYFYEFWVELRSYRNGDERRWGAGRRRDRCLAVRTPKYDICRQVDARDRYDDRVC